MARFVKVMGTGLMGRGMESGPKIHITAVITPVKVKCFTEIEGVFEDGVFIVASFYL